MKIRSLTYRTGILLLLVLALKSVGCETEDLDFYIDCDHCLEEFPEWDTLWVDVTINDENPFVPLEFHLGNVEDGVVDWVDTAYTSSFWLVSEVEVYYSVKATYKKDGKTLVAIDGDKIRVVNGEGECYPPCYVVRAGTLDVTLKE